MSFRITRQGIDMGSSRSVINRPSLAVALLAAAACLTIPASAGAAPLNQAPAVFPQTVSTGFDPARHEFKFRNYFQVELPVPGKIKVTGIPFVGSVKLNLGLIPLRTPAFGMCGGMTFMAADNYYANAAAPATDVVPPAGSPLFAKIFSRLADSLQVDRVRPDLGHDLARLLLWNILPEGNKRPGGDLGKKVIGINQRTGEVVNNTVEQFGANQVVPLMLVTTNFRLPYSFKQPDEFIRKVLAALDRIRRGPEFLSHNHQVLGIGTFRNANQKVIAVYDPNYPAGLTETGSDYGPEDKDGITYLYWKRDRQYSDAAGTTRVGGSSSFTGFFRIRDYQREAPFGN